MIQDQRHDEYQLQFHNLQTQLLSKPLLPTPPPFSDHQPKPPKLHLQPFDGSNPLEWIFQADQFFTYYSIPPHQRLAHIAPYMVDDALGWFQWMHKNGVLSTWPEFTHALELRFGPSNFENHQQALFKLRQTTSVTTYQRDFERLCNRVVGLPHQAILDCFLSSIKPEIQYELAILKPGSISDAIGLAKLVESKLLATRTYTFHRPSPKYPPAPTSNPNQQLLPPPNPRLPLPAPPKTNNPLPIRYLSPTKMEARRAKGLCFNCNERFHTGHRCKPKLFLLLMTDEDETPPNESAEDLYLLIEAPPPLSTTLLTTQTKTTNTFQTEPEPEHFHLSMDAMTRHGSPRTLHFTATIYGHPITVLVDTGSSHNILQARVTSFLNLPIRPVAAFSVMVGNGEHLQCSGCCHDVPMAVAFATFQIPFYLLPIQGADAVLGVQWL